MRRVLTRSVRIIAILVLTAILLSLIGAYTFVTRSFPLTNGTVKVDSSEGSHLKQAVHVIRDRAGVPHIFADNAGDLFFAQGYVQAQDRLWQMELNRHVGHGQLAELFGDTSFGDSTTVEVDKFLRTIGLNRAAASDLSSFDAHSREALQSFADGVNAFVHTHRGELPIEFSLLGYQPGDWAPIDTVVWAKVMAYDLGGNYEDELFRSQLIDALGEAYARQLVPLYPASGPFIIPPSVKNFGSSSPGILAPSVTQASALQIGRPDLDALRSINDALGMMGKAVGSDNWVVDGTRTVSGKPLLANDPHLGISMPSIWYMNALQCAPVSAACPYDVIGYSFPGVPGVVLGHNERIAWGVTNTGPDVQDLFVEEMNPANPNQYRYQGEWLDAQLDPQVIHVKDGPDVSFTIRSTRHGPILTPVLKGITATVALEWTATKERSAIVNSLFALDAAANWEDFRNALRLWDVPAQNFVYADIDGNIGYQLAGRIPIRARGDGTVPVQGSAAENEWSGYIPFDELPYVSNPESHFIATANNQVVPNDYKYLIASEFAAPFRAERIVDLLASKAKLSPDDFKRMQGDVYSLPLVKLRDHVVQVEPEGFLAVRAMKYVREWDGNLTQATIGGTILQVTYLKLVQDLLGQQLGDVLLPEYLQRGDLHHLLVDKLLDDPNNHLWDDVGTGQRETRDDRVRKAYWEGVDWLGSQFGDWPPDWHWGRIHTATFAHPFGSIRPLDLLFNSGPHWVPGDGFTLFNTGFDPSKPYGVQTLSSMREIVDLSNLDGSLWIQTTGESGQPLNSHYADLTPMWRDLNYVPMYFTKERLEENKGGDLILTP